MICPICQWDTKTAGRHDRMVVWHLVIHIIQDHPRAISYEHCIRGSDGDRLKYICCCGVMCNANEITDHLLGINDLATHFAEGLLLVNSGLQDATRPEALKVEL